jgi:hypothetical protein
MSTRFQVDLLHPGEGLRQIGWMARGREDWLVGPSAARHLGLVAVGCVLLLVLVLVVGILPSYLRLQDRRSGLPGLRKDLANSSADLGTLKANLGALSQEARRQVRWTEVLTALAQEIPPTLKLQSVEGSRVAPPGTSTQQPGAAGSAQQARAAAAFESMLRIDVVTPIRPGAQPLLETAQFMAGLMRDPAVHRRFQLRSWEIKPTGDLLTIGIQLAERAP